MTMMRMVLAEERTLFRQGLAALLTVEPDIEIVGEASDVDSARMVCKRTQPDIALLSARLVMTENSPSLCEGLRVYCPNTSIVVLRDHHRNDEAKLSATFTNHLPTIAADRDHHAFIRAIRAIFTGEEHPPMAAPSRHTITEREQEIIGMLAHGLSNKEIAQRLALSTQTVKNHVSRLLEKLALADRTQLAVYALEHHFDFSLPEPSDQERPY